MLVEKIFSKIYNTLHSRMDEGNKTRMDEVNTKTEVVHRKRKKFKKIFSKKFSKKSLRHRVDTLYTLPHVRGTICS